LATLEHTGDPYLKIEPGELVAVLGSPGSGKSRLAMELAFLTASRNGSVLFNGQDPNAQKGRYASMRRPREVAVLVQNAEEQLFARTVADDVAFGVRYRRMKPEQVRERVDSALTAVGLNPEEVRDRSPFALSGGERRRAALAGVLVMEPEILILDEPTASLDPHTRNAFGAMLKPLRDDTAVVWFTASAREAARADRTLLLEGGKTSPMPSGEALFSRWQELRGAGIELPAVYEVAALLQADGAVVPDNGTPDDMQAALLNLWTIRHAR